VLRHPQTPVHHPPGQKQQTQHQQQHQAGKQIKRHGSGYLSNKHEAL
jgi:hypothetical protein